MTSMLLDSNIIIYSSQPAYASLRTLIEQTSPFVSAISYVEVLGYPHLTPDEQTHFQAFFDAASILPLSDNVLEQAIKLRQIRKMSLGDALIAATALVHQLTLVTRDQQDFAWIPNLFIINPIDG